MDVKLLVALGGIIIAALSVELNDAVATQLLTDIGGGLGISHDQQTWFSSLYISFEILGMSISPWFVLTLTLRRWSLFVIGLTCFSTVLIPATANLTLLYALRATQGLCDGLTIPLLMTTALRALPPPIRLFGLAAYALTATVFPNLSTAIAALWEGTGDSPLGWQFAFYEAAPLALAAALPVWWGMPKEAPKLERFRIFDWRGALLVLAIGASLGTLLEQGDRLDWFNSQLICVLGLVAVVAVPLLLLNEWKHEEPLLKLQLLARPNLAYGLIALFTFLIITQAASTLPSDYLREVQGFRPAQAYEVTAVVALSQLVLLPVMAILLDKVWVDARVVSFVGLLAMVAGCIGDSRLTSVWQRGEFYAWQGCFSVGEALVVMPLLMMATNTVQPPEGPYASSLVNTPRAVGEAVGVWLLQLVERWRSGLHSDRLTDQLGQDRFRLLQGNHINVLPTEPPPLGVAGLPAMPGMHRMPGSLDRFRTMLENQTNVLTLSDAFVVMGAVAFALLLVLVALTERTYPPRIVFAKN